MKVLVIDPGERVGWAIGEIAPDGTGGVLKVLDHGIEFYHEFERDFLRARVEAGEFDLVIFERFRIRADKAKDFIGSEMPTIQLVGAIKYACRMSGTKWVSQGPKAMTDARISLKNPGGKDILRRLSKLPKSHDDAHDGSALLHLWTYYFINFY